MPRTFTPPPTWRSATAARVGRNPDDPRRYSRRGEPARYASYMPGTSSLPGPSNVYIPNAADSGNLFVDFSRNTNDFALLRYTQVVSVQHTKGVWWQMGLDERARITDNNGARFVWADGEDRPIPEDNSEFFAMKAFNCIRRSYASKIGKMTSEQAAWDERDRRSRTLAQQAMTYRTVNVINMLTTTGNWDASHVLDLSQSGNTIQGQAIVGNFAASTSARLTIRKVLNGIKSKILQDTRAAVKSKELLLIMNPDTASAISVTQEIVELIKESTVGLKYLKADEDFPKDNFGLPPRLYGVETLIEETVQVTSVRGLVTQSSNYVLPFGTVIVLHRPNTLEGVEGGRSFSTATIHIYREDDMAVEADDVRWDRVTNIAVTDNFDTNMTAPVSGFLLQNVC